MNGHDSENVTTPDLPVAGLNPPELAADNDRLLLVRKVSTRLLGVLVGVLVTLILITFAPVFGVAPPVVAPVVLLVGAIGGFVSIQRRIKTLGKEDLSLIAGSINYLLLAPFVGGILALTLYLMFLSGLVSGDLFPKFKPPDPGNSSASGLLSLFEYAGEKPTDYAKLLFWSFIGGYSERFVVDIIGNFESAVSKK